MPGRHLPGGRACGHSAGTRADRRHAPSHRRLRAARAARARPGLRRWRPGFGHRGARAGCRSGAGGLLGANAGGRPEAILHRRRCWPTLSWPTTASQPGPRSSPSGRLTTPSSRVTPSTISRMTGSARSTGEVFGLLNPGGVFVNIEHVSSSTEWLRVAESRDVHRLAPPPSPRTRAATTWPGIYYDRPDKSANILWQPMENPTGEWWR
jgi:hypothetical protein